MSDASPRPGAGTGDYLDPRALAAAWLARLPRSETGYAEAFDPSWREIGEGERTMLCQSRLAYVFVHAGILGVVGAAEAGSEAIERMDRHFWNEGARGWIRSIGTDGRPADTRIDSYDQAFGLLALAWAYRATRKASLREKALAALAGLDEASRELKLEGYPEWRPSEGGGAWPDSLVPRRQNPHMHLLEAFLAWTEADPAGPWLAKAEAMVELAHRRFIDPGDGILGEFFDQGLSPLPGAPGRHREPGHQFEWVWLLRRWWEASGDEGAFATASRLYRFACDNGRDLDGLSFDVVDPEGKIVADSKLLWPQTEMIKAHAAWYEWGRADADRLAARRAALEAIDRIRDDYLLPGEALWHSQLGRDRAPLPMPTLSRLLYHLFLSLVEAERVFGPRGA
ncbi:MAG TPA: AGE family epimerase/isomerase [Rectinemataceae bacterium]|nr:AGE family epimerase/isomerase [Rectinemataceae bacterium]